MTALLEYLHIWRVKLSHLKKMTAAFHLNNQEVKCELAVYNNYNVVSFCTLPTYLGVKPDRSLTFRHHIEALRKKLKSRVALSRRLAESESGNHEKTLKTAALCMVYSTSEYYATFWYSSACLITRVE